MAESSVGSKAGHPSVVHVVLPVVLLFIVIALLAGLVFSGLLQGGAPRVGPGEAPTTRSTIVIEP